MKKCPYCAEQIQDEAIKCRYCLSDLTVSPGQAGQAGQTQAATGSIAGTAAAGTEPVASWSEPVEQVHYTHSGHRYVLGYGDTFFGIWDRHAPASPVERHDRTDDGWRQAWLRFASLEPEHVAVDQPSTGAKPAAPSGPGAQDQTPRGFSETPEGDPGPGAASGNAEAVEDDEDEGGPDDALQYTHSGQRYLLGYGDTFFGIWDRQAPQAPVERFARDDVGWAAAWRRYTSIEEHYAEVGLGDRDASSGP